MDMFVTFGALITNYSILSFGHFRSISGEKPRCIGEPLKPDEFSKEEDVGFIRDLCVDLIARNLNNTLKRHPSSSCLDLANTRTSTCISKSKCTKWKRSNCWNTGATNRVIAKAEAMMNNFNTIVSENASLHFDEEKFIFKCIVDAERKLIDSKAVTKDSKIMDELRSLKNNFCTRYTLYQNQRVFQEKTGRIDAESLEMIDSLIRNADLGAAIKIFVHNFEEQHMVKIVKFYLINDIPKTDIFLSSALRLEFEFVHGESTKLGSVIMKIPSVQPMIDENVKRTVFDREVQFYREVLPILYRWCSCKPFAPRLYAVTKEHGFVLEDLTHQAYEVGDHKTQLNWDQIKMALDLLAKYHALGYKYLQCDPNMASIKTFRPLQPLGSHKFTLSLFYQILEASLSKSLYEKMLKVKNIITADEWTEKSPEKNSMTVIIHGDYQIDNILFKYDSNGRVSYTMMKDWHSSREANPVLDLIHFFVTSVPIQIFKHLGSELLDSYLISLNKMLSSIESNRVYDGPELNRDMSYFKHYYLKILFVHWQRMTQARLSDVDMQSYQTKLMKWLKYLDKTGVI